MSSKYERLPEEIKGLDRWVCYRLIQREGKSKKDKIPFDPKTGAAAKANDSSTWASFRAAVVVEDQGDFDGIGFQFGEEPLGIVGIDLDGVVAADGTIAPEAQEIIEALDSYTEYSVSGTGVHILCRGTLPPGGRRKGPYEVYDSGRFFVCTGEALDNGRGVEERTEQLAAFHAKYIGGTPEPVFTVGYAPFEGDEDLIRRIQASKNGPRFSRLWAVDYSDYRGADGEPDHSAGDLALVSDLIFWTEGDAYRADVLFRKSGMMRKKWDERRGAQTYGQRTIAKALSNYTPRITKGPVVDATQPQQTDPEAGQDLKQEYTEPPRAASPLSVADYLGSDLFRADVDDYSKYRDRKTGFSNLDAVSEGLYPGLYVFGAGSSMGKTTFIYQLADQLADRGEHVLFFSLEQSRLEMVTKGITRTAAAATNKTSGFTGIDIRRKTIGTDRQQRIYEEALKIYRQKSQNLVIIPSNFEITAARIAAITAQYMSTRPGIKPVVVVDYLQILGLAGGNENNRDRIRNEVAALKKFQLEHNLVVFVVSSLNRSNYMLPVDYESFKESGDIEYTADVVWGLQFQAINEDLFNKEGNVKKKRERLREAKKEKPRKIELICLKARAADVPYSCGFLYWSKYDLFEEDRSFRGENEPFGVTIETRK